MTDTLVTKQDLEARFAHVDLRFEELEKRIEIRLHEMEQRIDLRMREQLEDLEHRMTLRLGGIMVAGIGVMSVMQSLI